MQHSKKFVFIINFILSLLSTAVYDKREPRTFIPTKKC